MRQRLKEDPKFQEVKVVVKNNDDLIGDRNLYELNQEIKREFLQIYQRDLEIDNLIDALPIEG